MLTTKIGKGNEKDSSSTLHTNGKLITNNEEKHIVVENEDDIARDYLNKTKEMHSDHLYNNNKLKPTNCLNENSVTLLYSSIGCDLSTLKINISITQEDLKSITEN